MLVASWWSKWMGSGAAFLVALPCAAQSSALAVVHLKGTEPGMTFEVSHPGQPVRGPRCSDPCEATARPGGYDLHVFRGEARLGTARLKVTGPASFAVSPPNLGRQQTGLALGVTGSALLLAGFVSIAYAISQRHDCGFDETCKSRYTDTLWLGTAAVGLGGVLTPIGWVLFGTNRSPKVRLVAQPRSPSEASLSAGISF